jgi:hypothetical protein
VIRAEGSGGSVSDVAVCPADHPYVVSGGGQSNAAPLQSSYPVDTGVGYYNAWQVWLEGYTSTGGVVAFALCAK